MNATLLIVELVLLNQESGAALQDLGPTIADFLGPKRLLSLHEACKIGSLKLLDWVWRARRNAASYGKNAGWTLTNYLQTDRHYYQWQFSEALEVAAGRGDLDVVQWLFAHFQKCEVAVEVVEAAAANGRLGVLRFLLDHDTIRMGKSGRAASHSVRWGGRSLVNAVENGHSQVVRWLCENGIHGCGEAQMASAIKTALSVGDMPLAEFLLPRGKCILDYAEFCSHPDVIEWKLDCGCHLQPRSPSQPSCSPQIG